MKRVLVACLFFTCSCLAQAPPAGRLTPTENQALRLKNRQLEFQVAQMAMEKAAKAFQDEADKVKAENKWDKAIFNYNDLTFTNPPEPPKPEPKKDK